MAQEALEPTACPLCGSAGGKVHLAHLPDRERRSTERFSIVRCRSCAHLFLSPRPTLEAIGSYYQTDGSYLPHVDVRDRSLRARLLFWRARRSAARIARRTPAGGSVLEIGCGNGRHLDALKARGYRTAGVEPSAAAIAALARRGDHDVRNCTARNLDWPDATFDTVVMLHVIEHLHDPLAGLAEARRVLRPGGAFLVATPNAEAIACRAFGRNYPWGVPRHLQFFTVGSLRLALSRSGFREEQLGFDRLPIDWIRGLEYACGGPGGLAASLFSVVNPLWYAALAPLEAAAGMLGRGSRVIVWARRVGS